MKFLRVSILFSITASVLLLSKCEKDSDNCSSCPPATVGTPYELEVPQGFPQPFIPADNPMTVEGVELGRFLFYDKKLSKDLTMSCGSCHFQSDAFGDKRTVIKSTGVDGKQTRRHAMVLFNLAFQDEFFWDGRVSSLEEQSLHPIKDPLELANDLPTVIARLEADPMYPPMFEAAFGDDAVTEDRIAKAIAQFERIIISASSEFDEVKRLGGAQNTFIEDPNTPGSKNAGYTLFNSEEGDCFHCHGEETRFLMGAFGKDNTFLNNGLKAAYVDDKGRMEVTGNPSDLGKFKVPSTRNVEFSFPYMHDGSIPSLDSLIEFYNFGGHPGPDNNVDPNMKAAGVGRNWSQQQKLDLIEFLRTMTDYEFLENPAYSDPFEG